MTDQPPDQPPDPLSPFEHLVLKLIVENVEANGSMLCELDDRILASSVYKVLERLRLRGLVEPKRGVKRGTRQPSYYRPTAQGCRELILNDVGTWHVQPWCDWCDRFGLSPITHWHGKAGERYLEQQRETHRWQIRQAIDNWVAEQREQRAARRAIRQAS